jgi:uncharacterized protein (TIGR02246 family)
MKPFRNLLFIFLISMLAIYGCQKTPAPLTNTEKEQIEAEVRAAFDKEIKAANDHDADAMMQVHWNSQDYLYAGNGNITRGWESMHKVVSSIHSDPKYLSYTVDPEEVFIRVINREAAIITAGGYFNNFPGDEGPKSVKFAVTLLIEKIDGQWLVTVGHESTADKVL